MEGLSEFISNSLAEQRDNKLWTVYADGENRRGRIENCKGTNEYEAKEDAYTFIVNLEDNIAGR